MSGAGGFRTRLILAALCAAAFGGALLAQQPYRLRAYVDPPEGITEDTRIRLVIEAQGTGNVPLLPPEISGLKNLDVVSGPSSSFNSVWSNGQFSAKTQLTYVLQARGAGTAEIPALEVKIGDEGYRTQPIVFEVAKTRGGAPPLVAGRSSSARAGGRDADVFIRAEIGSSEVWVGQSVSLSVSLYAAEQVLGYEWSREPALANCWVEELPVEPRAESYGDTIEGRRYNVFPMKRKVLVPQAAGEFEIEPFAMQIQVRQRSSDPFDLFSFGRGTTVLRKTQPLKLEVRPLPEEGRPDTFSGAVGSYEFQASLDRQETSVNDAVALKATVQGEGFLGSVAPPTLVVPADLKVFDPKVSSVSRGVRGQMVSRKIWEWVLVPLTPGELELSDLTFDYFDPQTASYEVARASLLPLVVQRSGIDDDAPLAQGDVRLQRRDLAFIKPLRGQLRAGSTRVHRRGYYLGLLALPLLWGPLVVVVGRHRIRLQQNLGLARGRRARGRAIRRLRAAGKHVDGTPSASFHDEVGRALVGYIADRSNRSAAGLTYEVADELLASRGVDIELRRRFRSCLESCDFARFVPAAGKSERRTELLDEAKIVLDRLEKAW